MNEFLNKTIKAAKHSTLQIYEDDFSNLSLLITEEDKMEKRHKHRKGKPKSGVIFERSSETKEDINTSEVSPTLKSLRKYAAEQTSTEIDEIENWSSSALSTGIRSTAASNVKAPPAQQVYSRKDIRKTSLKQDDSKNSGKSDGKNLHLLKETEEVSGISIPSKITANKKSVGAVHSGSNENFSHISKEPQLNTDSRLDRLESLVQLLLSAEDLGYSSYPLFQKLMYKGVPKRMIVKWFDTLFEQGINPQNQQKLFAERLKLIIRDLISSAQSERLNHIMLFTGRSGSGKTSLITRLSRHPGFLKGSKVAIATIYPKGRNNYYSILPPFCSDYNLPHYRIDSETKLRNLCDEWGKYDHVLIDTPSLEMEGTELLKIVSGLKSATPEPSEIDVHYLVDTAVDSNAYNDPLAAEIGAEHIVLTHLDKSNKWGRSVQLIAQTDYSIRFISGGEGSPDTLLPFDSKLFTEKLLR